MSIELPRYIAHVRKSGGDPQSLEEHLLGVAEIAKRLASKIGLAPQGELIGLFHDLGKYSAEFQAYLKSATGLISQDEDEFVDARGLKGKVDHSTAGTQLVWDTLTVPTGGGKTLMRDKRVSIASKIKTPLLAERRKGLPPKRLSCEASASCYRKQSRHRSATMLLTISKSL